MIFLYLLLSLLIFFANHIYCKKLNTFFSPISIMIYIWTIFLGLAIFIGPLLSFYPVNYTVVLYVFVFLFTLIIVSLIFVSIFGKKGEKVLVYNNYLINNNFLFYASVVFFVLYFISSLLYFRDLSSFGINFSNIFSSFRLWKTLITTGDFNEDKLIFIFRNLSCFGTFFSLAIITNKGLKKKVSIMILLLYFISILIYPRRDVIAGKLVYILAPFLLNLSKRISIKKVFIGVISGIAILYMFYFISTSMVWGEYDFTSNIGYYSFCSFNSLQKAIDNNYTSNTDLIYGNTFYFGYMILKYINPNLTPPTIILDFLGDKDSVNVYTSLIAPYIDSHGDTVIFVFNIIIYALFISILVNVVIFYFKRKKNLASLIIYSSVLSCAIRSYFNPTFSYAEILIACITAVIFTCLYKFIYISRNNEVF